jgi:hypothetical protein
MDEPRDIDETRMFTWPLHRDSLLRVLIRRERDGYERGGAPC